MKLAEAKNLFKKNFIGADELKSIKDKLNIPDPYSLGPIPKLPEIEATNEIAKNYILILGLPKNIKGELITINKMREFFGVDPEKSEPCFYNQDWYLKEKFASVRNLEFKWYAVAKKVLEITRGKQPEAVLKALPENNGFPSAILTAFVFFANYFITGGEILWQHDFIWCADKDKNGDRIYTGRYEDPNQINKNGFNVHRHLSIRSNYGAALQIKNL